MNNFALEIIPAQRTYVGERFTLDLTRTTMAGEELPVKVTYVTTPTNECVCGTWTRQCMHLTRSTDGKPLCPTCLRPMKPGLRTLRPLVRHWAEKLSEPCESYV